MSCDVILLLIIHSGYSTIAQTGLLSLVVLLSIPVITGKDWNSFIFYTSGLVMISFVTLPFLWFKIQTNPVLWLVDSIVTSPSRLKLVTIWSLCVFVAVLLVLNQVSSGNQATTAIRKSFHFLIVAVFTTGDISVKML